MVITFTLSRINEYTSQCGIECHKSVKMLWPELLYYKNEIIWMDLEIIIPSEVSQRKTYMISPICGI